jgi:hypothetical protein
MYDAREFFKNRTLGDSFAAAGRICQYEWPWPVDWTILINYAALPAAGNPAVIDFATSQVNGSVMNFSEDTPIPLTGITLRAFGSIIRVKVDVTSTAAMVVQAYPGISLKHRIVNRRVANPAANQFVDIEQFAVAYSIAPYVNNAVQYEPGVLGNALITIADANLNSASQVGIHPHAGRIGVTAGAAANTVVSFLLHG